MGWNTSVIVMNDALSDIRGDPEFGRKLSDACSMVIRGKPVGVTSGCTSSAATVIETHHADELVAIIMGSNQGIPIDAGYLSWTLRDPEVELLKKLAEKHGFSLRRKRK